MDPASWTSEAAVAGRLAPLPSDSFLPTYVRQAAGQTDAPGVYHVGAALGVLAACIPYELTVPGLPGAGGVPGNLLVMLIGRQGIDRKSTAVEIAKRLLAEAAPRRVGDEPGSAEGFDRSVANQPSQTVFLEEMGDFFAQTEERPGGGNYATVLKRRLLRIFDRTPINKTYSKRRVVAPRPHISILGGINPALVAAHVTPGDWNNGTMSRFLTLWGRAERYMSRTGDEGEWDRLVAILKQGVATRPADYGRCLGLSPDAYEAWIAWDQRLRNTAETSVSASALISIGPRSRAPYLAVRAALLIAWGEGCGWPTSGAGTAWWITARHLAAGARIATCAYTSALALAEYAVDDDDMRRRRDALACVGKDWTPVGAITRGAKLLKTRLTPILDTLVAEGLIVGDSPGGLRIAKRYRLSPDGDCRPTFDAADIVVDAPDADGDDPDPAEAWNENPALAPTDLYEAALRDAQRTVQRSRPHMAFRNDGDSGDDSDSDGSGDDGSSGDNRSYLPPDGD